MSAPPQGVAAPLCSPRLSAVDSQDQLCPFLKPQQQRQNTDSPKNNLDAEPYTHPSAHVRGTARSQPGLDAPPLVYATARHDHRSALHKRASWGTHEHIQRRFRQTVYCIPSVEAQADTPRAAADIHDGLASASFEEREVGLSEECRCDDIRLEDGHHVGVVAVERRFEVRL